MILCVGILTPQFNHRAKPSYAAFTFPVSTRIDFDCKSLSLTLWWIETMLSFTKPGGATGTRTPIFYLQGRGNSPYTIAPKSYDASHVN